MDKDNAAALFKCPCGVTCGLWFSERLDRYACPACWDDERFMLVTDESGEKVIGRVHMQILGSTAWFIATASDGMRTYESSFTDLHRATERLERWLKWNKHAEGARVWREATWTDEK